MAQFLTIYIEEAHAVDEWWLPHAPEANIGGKACIKQHHTIAGRIAAAQKFVDDLQFPIETVCDAMNNEASLFFGGWPERLYIVEKGVIVYQGGLGPFDYKLAEVKDWLIDRFGLRGDRIDRR